MFYKILNSVARFNNQSLNSLWKNIRNVPSLSRRYTTSQESQSKEVRTVDDIKKIIMNSLGIQQAYSPLKPSRDHLLKYAPSSQDSLPTRSMQDSFSSAIIPLSTDIALQNKYSTYMGNARLGRLMEDMDMFAVWIVHQHVKLPDLPPTIKLPYTFVTILVDKIDFTNLSPKHNSDIRLSGHVSWVGTSSIEVVIWLEQKLNNKFEKMTRAVFLMASRNATNTKAAVVNRLVPKDEREKLILDGGLIRKKRRQQLQSENLFKNEPNDFEQNLVHGLFIKTIDMQDQTFNKRILPNDSEWMEHTRLSTLIIPYPEDRNAHNTVFGGFLMRHALELSWATAYRFGKQWPVLTRISDVAFHTPVPISSHIKFESIVIYTELHYMQIAVIAHVFDPVTDKRTTSNIFYYTFSVFNKLPQIIPRSYTEAMWYLDGRRKFQYSMGLNDASENQIDVPIRHV